MPTPIDSSSYLSTARAAHDLAELLKRVRPTLRTQTDELQVLVVRACDRLSELSLIKGAAPPNAAREAEAALALADLESVYQSLCELKRPLKRIPSNFTP